MWDVALIDGDPIIFAAGFGSEKSIKGELVDVDPVSFALHKTKIILEKIRENVPAESYKVFIADTCTENFRYKVAKTQPYKENRKGKKRPEHEQAIRDYLVQYHNANIVTGVEVDDVLGIEQCSSVISPNNYSSIICSTDKDLDMIPGWHYDLDWGKIRMFGDTEYVMKAYKKKQTYFISDPGFLSLRVQANNKKRLVGGGLLWFCAQLLMGDKVDNIPGVPKGRGTYGDVGAYEVLKDCKTYKDGVQLIWGIYKKAGLSKERLFEVAQLLWIKRAEKNDKIFSKEWLI